MKLAFICVNPLQYSNWGFVCLLVLDIFIKWQLGQYFYQWNYFYLNLNSDPKKQSDFSAQQYLHKYRVNEDQYLHKYKGNKRPVSGWLKLTPGRLCSIIWLFITHSRESQCFPRQPPSVTCSLSAQSTWSLYVKGITINFCLILILFLIQTFVLRYIYSE